ncbi:MAG TPA: 50S ribosomal protein L9 [Rhizomicrobium sp.]|nr:50S ribosomal protein L9 [Rhizomicrobium sp.]
MQVILLERVEKLGQMGDEVRVKDGFARNYLLPQKKALRANKTNREYFQAQRAQLEARNLERKSEAEKVSTKLDGQSFTLLRQAGDRGQLYGSVSPRDIAEAITAGGFSVSRTQIALDKPIKEIGKYAMSVALHPEVRVKVSIVVARTEDEADRIARGEDVLAERTEVEDAKAAAEEVFEEGAGPRDDEAIKTDAEPQ